MLSYISLSSLVIFLCMACDRNQSYNEIPNGVVVHSEPYSTRIIVYSPRIVRITRLNDKNFPEKNSLSVIAEPDSRVQYEVVAVDSGIMLITDSLTLTVNKNGQIEYMDKNESRLLSDIGSMINDTTDRFGNRVKNMQVDFRLSDQEGIYGLGQHQDNIMNYRGQEVHLVQTNHVVVVPFLLSTKSWGLLWDNYSYSRVDNINPEVLKWWCEDGDEIDYYFIAADNPDGVIAGYRELTGDAPMYGKWAYGYWQCKERYKTRDELLSTALKFRELNFPIDNIVQDWQYWGDYGWSALLFDEKIFPKPEEMIDILHKNNFHFMISVWSVFGENSPVYKEMAKHDLLFDAEHWSNSKFYDPFSPLGREIYWKHLKKGLFDKGVDAFWMDGTEPEFKPVYTHSEMRDAIAEQGETYLGPFTKYLNAYSLMTVKAAYEGQRSVTDKKRVFILTRSSYAGQQRYAGSAWSGDISADFKVLETQISAGINYCMSGLPYWTTDIGAFHVNSLYPDGSKDDAYKELYVRWFQYGAFSPLFRSHGTHTPREPWQFGEPGTWAYDILLKYTNLRYRLLPYIYSTAWKITNGQYSMMRGLPLAFPNDTNVYGIGDQFMFGDALMACPVTENFYYRSQMKGNVISPEYFYTEDGTQGGLNATYYDGINFNSEVNKRIDENIDFSWAGAPPVGCGIDSFSVRWTGEIRPDETGQYKLILSYRKGARVWIDNKLVIDQWNAPYQSPVSSVIKFEQGKSHQVKIEYFEDRSWPAIKLSWEKPSDIKEGESQLNKEKAIEVYLPKGEEWFDFWTGKKHNGGQTINTRATMEIMPLFVKAGSIIPFGPYLQFSDEKPADPLEIRIYPGKNAEFVLYEDENDNYNYEKGVYSTIQFNWDDNKKELTIQEQKGEFPGILKERIFNIVIVSKNVGTGLNNEQLFSKTINYSGLQQQIRF